MAITSGDLRFKITLKAPVTTVNDEGGKDVSYPADTIKTFAAVKKASQSRVSEAGSNALLYTKDFFIRWCAAREAITKDWLLVYNSESYIIEQIERMAEERDWIKIVASTKSNG